MSKKAQLNKIAVVIS